MLTPTCERGDLGAARASRSEGHTPGPPPHTHTHTQCRGHISTRHTLLWRFLSLSFLRTNALCSACAGPRATGFFGKRLLCPDPAWSPERSPNTRSWPRLPGGGLRGRWLPSETPHDILSGNSDRNLISPGTDRSSGAAGGHGGTGHWWPRSGQDRQPHVLPASRALRPLRGRRAAREACRCRLRGRPAPPAETGADSCVATSRGHAGRPGRLRDGDRCAEHGCVPGCAPRVRTDPQRGRDTGTSRVALWRTP